MSSPQTAIQNQKHIELHNAIQEMDTILSRLNDLAAQISGPEPTRPEGGSTRSISTPVIIGNFMHLTGYDPQ